MAGENAVKILALVEANPGRWSRESLLEKFDEDERHGVNVTISKLLSERSGKLLEKAGRLFPPSNSSAPRTADPIVLPKSTTSTLQPVQSIGLKPVFVRKAQEIRESAREVNLSVVFIVRYEEEKVKGVGMADTEDGPIFWMPIPAGVTLAVYMGDYEATYGMALLNSKYLVLEFMVNNLSEQRYFVPYPNQMFALSWE